MPTPKHPNPSEHWTFCGNCHYWSEFDTTDQAGSCHRHTPTANPHDPEGESSWPVTYETDWCGESAALEDTEAYINRAWLHKP